MLSHTLKFFAPVLLAASLALGACASANVAIEPDENVAAAPDAVEVEGAAHGPRGMPGHPFIAAALRDLELTAEQRKTIEAARDDLREGQPKEQMKAFHKALADQVRAGKIDPDALEAHMGDPEKMASERRAAVVKAVGTVHATLTPEQRTKLVTLLKERMQKHAEWKEKKHEGKHDGEHAQHEGQGRGGPMMFLLHGIDLRDEQREKIKAAMPPKPDADERAAKFEAHRAKMDAALEAFKGATFDAATVLPNHGGKGQHAERFLKMVQAVVPVLDAEQRAELAKRIEEGPRMGHHRGKHGRGHHGPGHHGPAHHEGAAE